MPKRIIYLPLEAYQSRYTEYTAARRGMYETIFTDNKIPFITLRPTEEVLQIKTGAVLDGLARSVWGFAQTSMLNGMIAGGKVNPEEDVIYIEDFWHPGFEMIPYVQSLIHGNDRSKHVPVYAFCHAQSTDPFDFTAPWAWWIRDMERGWLTYLNRVFCATHQMKYQFQDGMLDSTKLQPIGHIWNSKALEFLFSVSKPDHSMPRQPWVVYSSRLDTEKNPLFFCEVAKRVLEKRPHVVFKICSGHNNIKTNDPAIKATIVDMAQKFPDNFDVELELSKAEYFDILRNASVQMNTADQDFISYTLLEATYFGCAPLYPNYHTFPDALNRAEECLYKHKDVDDAVEKLLALLDNKKQEDYDYVWQKYESSGNRLLSTMGFNAPVIASIDFLNGFSKDGVRDFLSLSLV